MSVDDVEKYYKALTITLEMLTDRGYSVNDEYTEPSLEDFKELYKDLSNMVISNIEDLEGNRVFVCFVPGYIKFSKKGEFFDGNNTSVLKAIIDADEKDTGERYVVDKKDTIEEINRKYFTEGNKRGIIVYKKIRDTDKLVRRLEQTSPNIEFFPVDQLTFNVTKHVDNPEFELITDDSEIQELRNQFKNGTFGYIRTADPINKYYGGKIGNMYKISRDDGSVCLREVIEIVKL